MCFESICGFSCPVALAVYYLPTVLIGFVALFLHLRRRGFFKRSYVRFLRWLRRFAALLLLFSSVSVYADDAPTCTPMTYEECTNAVGRLNSDLSQSEQSISDIRYFISVAKRDVDYLKQTIPGNCTGELCDFDPKPLDEMLDGALSRVNELDNNVTNLRDIVSSISCCSSNGGNDGGSGGNDGGSSSCTNCACAEQIIAVKTAIDNIELHLTNYENSYLTPTIQYLNDVLVVIEQWYWDSAFYWDKLTLLDDGWYSYLTRLKQSVSQLRNTVTPDKISGFWEFNNILQGQAFIYSAEYKTQLLTELFGNTITQQLSRAFRLSQAFGHYEDSKDWLGIVNPDWQAAIDAYTSGGDGDGSMDDWIKGDGNVTNYFHRMETYNQQIVKFLALMNRTNDLETVMTNDPYAYIDSDYSQAEQKATSDVSGTSSHLESFKSPFQRLYDSFVVLRESLRIQNPSSATSFRWVPDNIDFSQQGVTSNTEGITLNLSESSYLGRGVALFNTLFSFIWVVLCVVVCGYLAFRCALLVHWIFTFLFGLVEKISER